MSEPWLRIVKDERFTTGPTIPYILGALRDPIGAITSEDASKKQLRDLLLAMRDEVPAPECVVILWCSFIKALVVSARPGPPEGRRRIDSPRYPDRALYYREIDGYQVDDLESLLDALWKIHSDVILEGRFSRHDRKWYPIDEGECEEIRKTLAAGV